MHGEDWDGNQDLTNWWMTEKFDGVRAYWDGEKLCSKQGRQIACPSWFIEDLPKETTLDGELWMGRRTLEDVVVIVKLDSDPRWKSVKYVVFDTPKSKQLYEERSEELAKLKFPPHVTLAKKELCRGNQHLLECLNSVVQGKGEGLMLVKPNSPYIGTRTSQLLKVKVILVPF